MWEKILRPFLSLYIIGAIGEASEPKCIKAECDNKQASGRVIRQRVILLAIRAIHMLLMIADMILSMMMEIMTGTDIRKIRTMLMV